MGGLQTNIDITDRFVIFVSVPSRGDWGSYEIESGEHDMVVEFPSPLEVTGGLTMYRNLNKLSRRNCFRPLSR